MVAAGILASRLTGFARSAVVAHFLGNGAIASAWTAAFRIPNFLQNLFGEGALSASFIPAYSRLEASGERETARALANAVAALLTLVVAVLVAVGVLLTPLLVDLIAPGFSGETRALTVRLVRIAFPGTGILVLSAWCLGVLNSHRRFFISYAAPVVWNAAIIGAFLAAGSEVPLPRLAEVGMYGAVVGSVLQLAVQVPAVFALLGGVRVGLVRGTPELRGVVSSFAPIAFARGVTQVSAFVDTIIASKIALGAVASLGYAQLLATLPISLFGMSVSVAELPEMARATGTEQEVRTIVRERLDRALRQVAYFVIPSAVAFASIGHVLAGLLFESGRFTRADSITVWSILAATSVGLLAATLGRVYSSSYYALRDTRTPLRFALLRVAVGLVLAWLLGLVVPDALGISRRWATAGLALGAALAAWLEFSLLRHTMNGRVGPTGVPASFTLGVLAASAGAAASAWGLLLVLNAGPKIGGIAVAGTFGLTYVLFTYALGLPEARALLGRFSR